MRHSGSGFRRIGRYAVIGGLALALTATTNTSVAAPAPVDSRAESRTVPLPAGAVTPVTAQGRWFSISQRNVGPGQTSDAPKGRQSLIKITGRQARQRFAFDVALPAGAWIAPYGQGLVARNRNGDSIGVLKAPWAVDAKGIKVSTRFEVVDRDTFVQVVEHRTVATYPVYADPWFVVPVIIRVGAQILGRYVVRRATYEAAKRAAAKLAAKQAQMDIDDLLARQPIKLLKLNATNFRENVRRRTGWKKTSIVGYDAHHTLPKKFENAFNRAGINIHNPVYGHWWCRSAHRSYAARYNRAWERWLAPRRDDITNTSAWRNAIEQRRIALVSRSWSSTYQCPN